MPQMKLGHASIPDETRKHATRAQLIQLAVHHEWSMHEYSKMNRRSPRVKKKLPPTSLSLSLDHMAR
jgi:hypothetical protein